jgi:hypothetical protein
MTSYINACPEAGLFGALIEVFAVVTEKPWADTRHSENVEMRTRAATATDIRK